jgi:S1-C subfamily serine protease
MRSAFSRLLPGLAAVLSLSLLPGASQAQPARVIERVKPSIVAIATYQRTRVPQVRFLGTGFAVGNGNLIATNAHVIDMTLGAGPDPEALVVVVPTADAGKAQIRATARVATDTEHDIALVRIEGGALPALVLRDSEGVAEGDQLMFTGFPIGTVLGLFPATHRAMVAALTPIVIPTANAQQLDPKVVRRLQGGGFKVFQLDATAFPGNSGSPLYDAMNGEVVGILNMVFVKGTKEAALTQPSGISYAIPSRHLIELLSRAGK